MHEQQWKPAVELLSDPENVFPPFYGSLKMLISQNMQVDKSGNSSKINPQKTAEDGGSGSGNFGHSGRKGQTGGSTSNGGGSEFANEDYHKALNGLTTSAGKKVRSIDPHLYKQAKKRNVYPSSIAAALEKGTVSPGNLPGRSVYNYRGTAVVFVDDIEQVKTVIYKGQKAKRGGKG